MLTKFLDRRALDEAVAQLEHCDKEGRSPVAPAIGNIEEDEIIVSDIIAPSYGTQSSPQQDEQEELSTRALTMFKDALQ